MIPINEYLKNLNRIEFVITYDCTGKCKHCSEGEHSCTGIHIDKNAAADAVYKIFKKYNITSVMTFGGEPLLYPEAVFAIHSAARDLGILKRQLITNGYFANDDKRIKEVVLKLNESGVNDTLLSVDAFHQETIPIDMVKKFARYAKEAGLPIKTSPAWLVSREDENPYNIRTRKILSEFSELGIEEGCGNVVFASGNAIKYLSDYFDKDKEYNDPYIENPYDVKAVSIEPNGDIFSGNIYREDVAGILERYLNEVE